MRGESLPEPASSSDAVPQLTIQNKERFPTGENWTDTGDQWLTPEQQKIELAEHSFQPTVPDSEDVTRVTDIPVPSTPRDVNVKSEVSRIEGRAGSKAANPQKKSRTGGALLGSVLAINISDEHFPNPMYDEFCSTAHARIAEVFLVKKAVNKEVKWKNLASGRRRDAYLEAMSKEWKAWNDYGSVQILTPQQWKVIKDKYPDLKTVPTRWVPVDKNESKRGNSSYEEVPELAKARLAVVGCFDKGPNIGKDSPTGSLHCLLQMHS